LIALPQAVKSMRVTLVSRSHLASRGDDYVANAAFAPLVIENHTPAVMTPDGYERVTFKRRVELPNMAMTSF
jgi:stage V sporulation protein SpoVS